MEASPGSSDDDSEPLSPAARSPDGDADGADLEAGVMPAPGDARTVPPRRNRYALIAAAALTAVAIVVIENLNRVHGADDYWTRRYDDVGGNRCCEADGADTSLFIIEPVNARSDYPYIALGSLLICLAVLDWTTGSRTRPEANGLMRNPHVTLAHGVFNVLHGLGSLWHHACECEAGGRADVAGVLAVNVFPVLYIPLWLAVPAHPLVEFVLSAIPIVGQSVFYARAGRLPLKQTFFVVVLLTILLIPACVAYLHFCRNRKARLEQRRVEPQTQMRRAPSSEELVVGGAAPPPRRGQRRQVHVLKLWLYALALVLFFGGWLAWKNDLNGTWCFDRNSPFYWLQGHAVWHVLTMGALGCIYWFFRSEKISYS